MAAGAATALIREPGPREPGPREPGPREPGPREPGPREPGPREPGPRRPGRIALQEPRSSAPSTGRRGSNATTRSGNSPAQRLAAQKRATPGVPAPGPSPVQR